MRRFTALLSIVLFVTVAGCSSDKNNGDDNGGGDLGTFPDSGEDVGNDVPDDTADVGTPDISEPDAEPCDNTLVSAGPTTLVVGREERITLGVRLSDCNGAGLSGQTIDFAIVGDARGSELRNTSARTDGDGDAEVTLISGTLNASFEVEVTSGDAQMVVFTINVMGESNGDISVVLADRTAAELNDASVFLFEDVTCDEIDRFDPLNASLIEEPVGFGPPAVFEFLAPGEGYVVAAQGRVEGDIMGFGCVEEIEVVDGMVTDVTVELKLIPIRYTGLYELDNEFDLAGVLPSSIENTLRILDELSDDNSLAGNPAADEWGVDPAAFVLDYVYREICCWEAVDSTPETPSFDADFDSCRDQEFTHPIGDLEQLYTENFATWDGAQSRLITACTLLQAGNTAVQSQVQDFILDNVPDIALRLVDIAGDLSRAFTEMQIISELTVGEVAVGKNGTFTHELITMVVELHDLDGDVAIYEFPLAEAGLENLEYTSETTAQEGDILVIPEHSFRLDFGRLLRFVFTDILLPTLDCDRDHDGTIEPCETTADLVGTWIDCGEVAEWLEDSIGLFPLSTYESFCDLGVNAAGGAIEGAIESSVDAETVLTLEGTTVAGSIDINREAETLVDGVWEGTLVEDEEVYGEFPGVFTGERTSTLD